MSEAEILAGIATVAFAVCGVIAVFEKDVRAVITGASGFLLGLGAFLGNL